MKALWVWTMIAVFGLCAAQEDKQEMQPLPKQMQTQLKRIVERMASEDAKVRARARADMRKILVAADGKDLQHMMVAWLRKEQSRQKSKTAKRELDIVLHPWKYYDRLHSLSAYRADGGMGRFGVAALAISPDGKLLASGGADSTGNRENNAVKIWD